MSAQSSTVEQGNARVNGQRLDCQSLAGAAQRSYCVPSAESPGEEIAHSLPPSVMRVDLK